MSRVRSFILSNFSKNYFLIFFPFFSILSVSYIIQISLLTNKMVLDFWEIIKIFGMFLPDIFFYTIPLSFIAALTVTLMKLSEDNELIALFSFGLTSTKLMKVFILPALLFTALMLIVSLYTIPQSTLSYNLFKAKKLTEAKLAITPNKLGQRFGNYIIFLGDKKDDRYSDVVLFATDNKDKRVIFIADSGSMDSNGSEFSLSLYNGTGDTFLPKTIESINYKKMSIFSYPKDRIDLERLQRGWSKIWESKRDMAIFVYNIFLSLSPLLILGVVAAFSIINPRYQKSRTYTVSFIVTISVYAVATMLKTKGTPLLLLIFSALFIAISIVLFYKQIRRNF